jgi:Icc-related predicted phosphoesterase
MIIGALGDIHGDVESVRRIMRRHPGVPYWLCVGDVADAAGRYEPFDAPLYWIKGNNENFDAVASGDLPPGHHYIPNGVLVEIDGPPIRVAGVGGTLAPTWYDSPASGLPHPKKGTAKATDAADRRRHFVREEVEACKALRGVDIFLSHEAPRPYRVGRGIDAGKTPINEILAGMKPRLHLFGHHHRFAESERQGVPSVGLDVVSKSYLLIAAGTLEYHLESAE